MVIMQVYILNEFSPNTVESQIKHEKFSLQASFSPLGQSLRVARWCGSPSPEPDLRESEKQHKISHTAAAYYASYILYWFLNSYSNELSTKESVLCKQSEIQNWKPKMNRAQFMLSPPSLLYLLTRCAPWAHFNPWLVRQTTMFV